MTSIPTRAEIHRQVEDAVRRVLKDLDFDFAGTIGPNSRVLVDLDLESVQVVQLFAMIQKRFGNRKLPFQELIFRGDDVLDFTLGDLAEFIHSHLAADPSTSKPPPQT